MPRPGAACHDPRFPPVRPDELEQLTVEVSLLHSRELLGDSPDARLSNIVIGLHGLDIQHYGRTGLLLPSVAVDQGWDAFTFLCEVCRKAGLPVDTGRIRGATVYRFSATHVGVDRLPGRPRCTDASFRHPATQRKPIVPQRSSPGHISRNLAEKALGRGPPSMYQLEPLAAVVSRHL